MEKYEVEYLGDRIFHSNWNKYSLLKYFIETQVILLASEHLDPQL